MLVWWSFLMLKSAQYQLSWVLSFLTCPPQFLWAHHLIRAFFGTRCAQCASESSSWHRETFPKWEAYTSDIRFSNHNHRQFSLEQVSVLYWLFALRASMNKYPSLVLILRCRLPQLQSLNREIQSKLTYVLLNVPGYKTLQTWHQILGFILS